jgi:hypothetical protein
VRNGATISAVDEAVGKPERLMTLPCDVPIVDFPIVLPLRHLFSRGLQ